MQFFRTLLVATMLAAPAWAQVNTVRALPAIGEEATATAGSPIFVRENVIRVPGVRLLTNPSAGAFRAGDTLELMFDRKNKVVACALDPGGANECLTDRKPVEGMFDVTGDVFGMFPEPLSPPVPYERGVPHYKPNPDGTFRQQLSFLGVAGNTLRLSYREFTNDMARPAFTDEVTFTLSGSYPETIAYKDVVIDVLGIGNAGMRYVVRKADGGMPPPTPVPN